MKTFFILSICVICSLNQAISQSWSGTTPGNIYYNSGNVGIQNTNPLSPLMIGGPIGTNVETNGITLSHLHNVIEFINSDYSLGYGAKIYGKDEGTGRTSLRVAVRGNSNTWQDALYIGASDEGGANNGLVGVGTTTPEAGLHVKKIHTLGDGSQIAARFGDSFNHWTYFGPDNSGRIRGGSEGYLWIESNPNGGSDKRLYLNAASPGDVTIAVGGGNVLIGKVTQANTAYKLDIAGSVRANEIVVNTTGADYVFEEGYHLRSLNEVEDYIQEHGHLPGIPSALEMQEKGMAVGELNKKLLEKVEEMTLYQIELMKIIKEQNERLSNLEKRRNEENN
ncbi:hypothetical protein FNH22_13295 [Fulvivirga sp. M361]|uniref:hypothetical protein n=1 Tax=Fulvivirga sp. M361 TaxID=2594266 RepID=UPI00117A3A7A|nr:hypothetical protein [Fulvivirga sp. M361]TRX58844.1 hypothetical protein FNH22_13295 [Fulvivirga sp. M361]